MAFSNPSPHPGDYSGPDVNSSIGEDAAQQNRLLKILVDLSFRFINVPLDRLDQAIDEALMRVAQFNGADRAYLLVYDWARMEMSNTHEWCAPGISSEKVNLQRVPLDLFPEWLNTHKAGRPFLIPDVCTLSPNSNERKILEPQGIRTLLTLPLMDGEQCLGSVGFDAVNQPLPWTDDDVTLLQLLAELLVNAEVRRRNETAVQEAESRLKLALNSGDIGVWEWHEEDVFRGDTRMVRLLGMAPGQEWPDVVCPEDQERIRSLLAMAWEQKSKLDIEFRVCDPSGDPRYLKAYGVTQQTFLQPTRRIVGVALDVTAAKQVEEVLRQALEREKELGELRNRFISMTSHEFRNPLAIIMATAETLIAYRHKLTETQLEQRLERIRLQVLFLREMMDDVLQFSRLESGRITPSVARLDLDKLMQCILDDFQSTVETPRKVHYQCVIGPVWLNLDERLIYQVVSNLLSNAQKYTPTEKSISVSLTAVQDEAILCIQDEGIGIPPEDLPHLFEPFHRATNVGIIEGTGLGLPIVQQLVSLHGGHIEVSSEPGSGSKFCIYLPRNLEEAE